MNRSLVIPPLIVSHLPPQVPKNRGPLRLNRGRGSAESRSRALRAALRQLRDAWPEPYTTGDREKIACDCDQGKESGRSSSAMWRRRAAESPALTPRPGASPGLLRRRYSVPETVMRKYRLAQMSSEETIQASVESCSCCTLPEMATRLPRDRELMRRSALLRRLQGRACRECCAGCCGRATRSLDASHTELRLASARRSPVSGRNSPKRLRIDSPSLRTSRVALSPISTDFALSDSSSRVHTLGVSLYTDTDALGPSSTSDSDYKDATDTYTQGSRDSTTIIGTDSNPCCGEVDDYSYSSETCSTSLCTTKETVPRLVPNVAGQPVKPDSIDGRISEITSSADNEDGNIFPYDKPLTVETPSYDVLEIVVSETFNTIHTPISNDSFSEKYKLDKNNKAKSPSEQKKRIQDVRSTDIDEYVSNILVESLNSLSDQLESMNASMGANRRLSVIEKEIKVKLQNTGVNTIVHLSPTSNNQIIFGHEELCSSDERLDSCKNVGNSSTSPAIRDELHSVETNNNLTSAESIPRQDSSDLQQTECFTKVVHSDNVNKAVLQQIQKLFQEDLQSNKPDTQYSNDSIPSISHIEISNVDVYIDNHAGSYASSTNGAVKQEQMNTEDTELIGSVSTCNYYENSIDNATIPRYSAFPHTESMEVNTSSSDDAEVMGSECTSLVDSLDDPNSPRSIMLRKSANSSKRNELVRSSIDVLDLLPENSYQTKNAKLKEKSESFFVRIKDDSCECDREKKSIVVADHMPETIKQRLYRRHRKRELRMECARRSKVKQLRKELEKQRQSELQKSKKEIEKECVALMNAIIDDVIYKIAQDEYKYMRIKQKSLMMVTAKSDESLSKESWKKDIELNNNHNKLTKNNTSQSCSEGMNKKHRKAEKYQIRGKLSLQTYAPLTPDDNNSKRLYQKSEIHDGKKCIEILEILEYVNSSGSSSEYSHFDDNQIAKHKKSRIPIPVSERIGSQYYKDGPCTRAQLFDNRNKTPSAYSTNVSQVMCTDQESPCIGSSPTSLMHSQPTRRASVPHCEPRSRSNSVHFKRVFDMIPEERSSFSIESPAEDLTQSRRASAPTLAQGVFLNDNEIGFIVNNTTINSNIGGKFSKLNPDREVVKKVKEMKSAGTSPMPNKDVYHSVLTQTSCTVMTSPLHKSAATSPIRNLTMSTQTPLLQKKSISNQQSPQQRYKHQQKIYSHSQKPQPEHHYQQQRQHARLPRQCNEPEPALRQHVTEGGVRGTFSRRRSVSSQHAAERLPRCGNTTGGRAGVMASGVTSGAAGGASSSSSSSESGGSLLCPLAPAWLQARRRRRRAAATPATGQWAVTVAGSCPAALPADVEMRLRFPETRAFASREHASRHAPPPPPGSRRAPLSPPAPRCAVRHGARTPDETGRFTLTLKKEASDSSILASKSLKKSKDPLPDVETFRASRSKTKSSVKMRRGYSLHCWLPEGDPTPIRASNGLSVLGSAIVPELKPRVRSMSQRDLTRVHRLLPAFCRY
ncbi:unnamed protein product [Parnassius apollo]|uniref:(apollo) hypothetical protein n=1 Tax=Parnassius apollo TaxID=110799 RepID=A0A8S3YDW4_PARAO|nr:unnamed protein product [Parnassius apollo]